ncbi:leucine-rich repeat domain-containing protein [Brachyspira intermedia]|uniref:leucine-rich repeat domain-containing protein n=1 Tax=Brachyspira intermedia TaxID=84377 RepID=UPI003005AB8D
MRKIILIISCLMILLSCRGSVTSPNNTDNNSGNITEEPAEPPMTEEELNKYGLEIDTATAENIRESLEKYFKDNGEYKLILKGVSTKMYTGYVNLAIIIGEIKDITYITVSFKNVQFQNNKLPDNILGSTSFDNNNITKVILPDYITAFGDEVFFQCISLTEVNMPKSLTEIGISIFVHTKVKNISLPNGLKIINDNAFSMSDIENIDIPDSVIRIGEYVFASCYKLQSVKLSENLSVIDKFTFSDCPALKTITIPESVTSIEDLAFYACSGAENIMFEGTNPKLTTIGDSAFGYCRKLTTITIPATVISIVDLVFSTCESLTSITFLSANPPSINGDNTFKGTILKNIYVPKGASSAYESLKGKHGISADVVISEI